ncbi:MAG: MFS transporter [Candidatus Woesearchaeota archaeon]|jgi:MFS family permease
MKKIKQINKNVYLLGIVSLLTDISSELIFSVFSVFYTVILGASTALLGLVEGLADFSASSLDYISGYFSDKTGKRKIFALWGYGFSTVAKCLLLFSTVFSASLFRIVERLGKSFRSPPRDAWLSSFTTKKNRGFSFGIHKTLDKIGAIIGPLIAYGVLSYFGETKKVFFWLFLFAIIPAIASIIMLMVIKETPIKPIKKQTFFQSTYSKKFKQYLWSAGIFSLAYFSFGFLLLKAYTIGFAIKDVVLLYALFNVSFVLVAAPIGKIADKVSKKIIISTSYVLYTLMAIGFIFAKTKLSVILLFVLYGVFYAIDASQTRAYIVDLEKKRATAIGLYNYITGIIYLPASIIAGILWKYNPSYAFGFAAIISLIALIVFVKK